MFPICDGSSAWDTLYLMSYVILFPTAGSENKTRWGTAGLDAYLEYKHEPLNGCSI